MADYVQRPHEAYGYSWLRWQMPHRFNGQPMLLSHSLPGSAGYQAQAMETLERFGSRVRGAEMRLQDLGWAMIVETVLARVLVPHATRVPPPRPRRTPYRADIDFSMHRIVRAPPTLDEARAYMAEVTGIEVPEDHQQRAWVMDCFLTEASVRAGGRATVQYIAVLNSVYRRVAMAAAGAASAPQTSPFWHGDLDVGDASDHRIGNVYESIAGVWFIERRYDKIMDLLCFIIDIQAPRLDNPMMPEALRGSESLVWRGPFPAALFAFPEYCRLDGEEAAMAMVQDSRAREQRLVDRNRGDDFMRGTGVEIDYMERGRHGGTRRATGSGPSTATGLPQGTPMLPVLRALLLPLLPPPLPPAAQPDQAEPRYFPTCAACQEEVEQVEEWTWFAGGVQAWGAPAVLEAVRDPLRARREGELGSGRSRLRCTRATPCSVPHLP